MDKGSLGEGAKHHEDEFTKIILSWSLDDILNEDLYKNKVENIPLSFESQNHYFGSFVYPLLEETRCELASSMEIMYRAPFADIIAFNESKSGENMLYDVTVGPWKNQLSERGKDAFHTLAGDLLILVDGKPESVSDLQHLGRTWAFSLVKNNKDDSTSIKVKASKPIEFQDGMVEVVEIAKFLRDRVHKDSLRLMALMISMKETELSQHYMLRKQHDVIDGHYDMPLIYYVEGHTLHFGLAEFALITGFRFGSVSFGLYTSGDLKFRERIFPHRIGLSVTILDLLGVIEDEDLFGNISDERCSYVFRFSRLMQQVMFGRLRLCQLYQGQLLGPKKLSSNDLIVLSFLQRLYDVKPTCDIRPTRAEYGSNWWTNTNDYIQQYIPRPPPLIPESSLVDAYFAKLEKKRKLAKLDFCELPSVSRSDSSVREPSIKDRVITELNIRVSKLESIIQVLHCERSGGVVAPLAFNDCFSNMTNDFLASLNNLYLDLIKLPESDEDIVLEYIREEELRLRLEEEDRLQLEDEKMRKQELRIRVDEYKRMRSEEEMVSHLAEEKKKKRNEYVNSAKLKKSLRLLAPNKRNHADGLPSESNYKVSWVKLKKTRGYINDPCMIERLKNVKPWKELLLQNTMPLFYVDGRRYPIPWSDVDQVLMPINETERHWCVAHFDILSGLVTFYDSGNTYDYECRDWFLVGKWFHLVIITITYHGAELS
ncbi:uvrD-like Helicase, ATP-binding domain, P-loop containing nucleoside triphosphate hydrolase [Artemisia annua]|uniref:UvrD-like Helicase, ATP-binding domain, P-loop containing nucleoside triphosphate hydrolase n=1 Tax=Artemisia annua TaxID=35608 RepID=A0A2U1NPU0_ARTAN|nr:uvrD-like Helicase, ATP-binding domain, P-loop containing nucleoside triphosphate hydrolase [Artemisia annua]